MEATILIPVYTSSEEQLTWLDECIRSVIDQAVVMVCNDASPVDPTDVLTNYKLVHIYNNTDNMGVSYTRNKLAFYAKTDLILPLDCDDMLKPNAVKKLLAAWKGIPLYPDLSKFGEQIVPHFRFHDFGCDVLEKALGLCSVVVLQSREQWKEIKGWKDDIRLYEDSEYNARLMKRFCGERYPEPLLDYRIRSDSRSRINGNNKSIMMDVLTKIRSYSVACKTCGGKKTTKSMTTSVAERLGVQQVVQRSISMASESLTAQEGKVLATYIGGKGKAKHWYKGRATGRNYRVIYGEIYPDVDPSDAREEGDVGNPSLFVKVSIAGKTSQNTATRVVQTAVRPEVQQVGDIPRVPKVDVERTPVKVEPPTPEAEAIERAEFDKVVDGEEYEEIEIPTIEEMTVKQVRDLKPEPDMAAVLLRDEENGKNRPGVVKYLRAIVDGDEGDNEFDD